MPLIHPILPKLSMIRPLLAVSGGNGGVIVRCRPCQVRLFNDRFCDPWERSEIRALGGLTIGILN